VPLRQHHVRKKQCDRRLLKSAGQQIHIPQGGSCRQFQHQQASTLFTTPWGALLTSVEHTSNCSWGTCCIPQSLPMLPALRLDISGVSQVELSSARNCNHTGSEKFQGGDDAFCAPCFLQGPAPTLCMPGWVILHGISGYSSMGSYFSGSAIASRHHA